MLPIVPALTDPYLIGLVEAGLSIHYRKDSGKVFATYSSPSKRALYVVQQAFGGIVPRAKVLHVRFNVSQVTQLARTLGQLNTPLAPVYEATLAIQRHKATADGSRASRDILYRKAYNAELDRLVKALLTAATVSTSIGACEAYNVGVATAKTPDKDKEALAALIRAKPQDAVQAEIAERRRQKVKTRLEAREKTLRGKEEAKAAARKARQQEVAVAQAAREAKWAANRETRAVAKKQAKADREAARTRRIEQELRDVANGVRQCGYCEKPKPLAQFCANAKNHTGYGFYCKPCIYEHHVQPNREKSLMRCKAWQAANPETFKASCRKQNAKPLNKLRKSIRSRMKDLMTRKLPKEQHVAYSGCSMLDLKAYLQTLWQEGMTWANHGNGPDQWVIDHTIPINAFDLTKESHIYWCFNYRNLRPLWGAENAVKSDLIDGISVRQLRTTGREAELHELVGDALERMGIVDKNQYRASLADA